MQRYIEMMFQYWDMEFDVRAFHQMIQPILQTDQEMNQIAQNAWEINVHFWKIQNIELNPTVWVTDVENPLYHEVIFTWYLLILAECLQFSCDKDIAWKWIQKCIFMSQTIFGDNLLPSETRYKHPYWKIGFPLQFDTASQYSLNRLLETLSSQICTFEVKEEFQRCFHAATYTNPILHSFFYGGYPGHFEKDFKTCQSEGCDHLAVTEINTSCYCVNHSSEEGNTHAIGSLILLKAECICYQRWSRNMLYLFWEQEDNIKPIINHQILITSLCKIIMNFVLLIVRKEFI